jgi:hypothetical protein
MSDNGQTGWAGSCNSTGVKFKLLGFGDTTVFALLATGARFVVGSSYWLMQVCGVML